MPSLPPLNALRAFEAAARHLSMKEAAAELAVTPGAVSQLVRGLEERLGTRLFRRGNRSLVLTEAGQSYFAPIRHAFRQIGEATRRLQALPQCRHAHRQRAARLRRLLAGAAARPLPRASRRHRTQHRHHPQPGEFRRRRRRRGDPPRSRPLSGPALRPHRHDRHDPGVQPAASSPRCGDAAPQRPADLLGLTLLHDAERQDWALWFQAQGVADISQAASSGISFDDQMLLIRAAASNQGIALVTETLARPELERGNLVRVLDVAWPQEFAYWLVVSARHRRTAEDRRLPRLAAGRGTADQCDRASSQASSAGPNALRLL